MTKFVKLLKAWSDHTGAAHDADAVLEVDVKTADMLIEKKIAAVYDQKAEAEAKATAEKKDAEVKALVEGAVKSALASLPQQKGITLHVETKDLSDEDPTFGFLPNNQKSLKDLSKHEILFAAGQFMKSVYQAGNGGRESEALMKCRERGERMLKKAAGDGLVVSSDQDGGYLIFSAASQMMNLIALENAVVRPLANKVTLNTQILKIPYLRDVTHASGLVYGGIHIYFDDELAQSTSSKVKFAQLEFKLKKMTAMGYASEEWIKWSPVSLGSWLIPRFGEAIGYKEDLCFIAGKGGAQPLGILYAPCKIEVAKESNQTASTVVLTNTTKMFARLREMKAGSVRWLMNRTVFPQLPKLNVEVGTGGAPVFINSAVGAPSQSLWGYPIVWSEKIPALGSAGQVTLTDFSDYTVADDQSGPEVAQSIHLKFDYGQTAFRVTKYIDGQNVSDTAFTPVNGDSLSPVVTLAS